MPTQRVNTDGRWFQVVIFLVGLMVGGGGSSFVGHFQFKELEKKIDKLSGKLSDLAETVARIEGYINMDKE